MPDGVTPRKKIALCGFASPTKNLAPFEDPAWAIAGMNQLNRHLPRRGDLWFEIHKEWNTAVVPGTDHEAWLRDCGLPVLMSERVPGLPTSVRFPVERLIAKFGLDYFTSTVAYMMAYAIDYVDRRVEAQLRATPPNGLATAWDVAELARTLYGEWTIGLFGIDLNVGEEYTQQRPCGEFWCGQAMARDITLMIPRQSALLKQRVRYGQPEPDELVKDSDLAKRHAYLTGEHQKHSEIVCNLVGALQEIGRLRTLGKQAGAPVSDGLAERHAFLTGEHQKHSEIACNLVGALQELERVREFRRLREQGGTVEL